MNQLRRFVGKMALSFAVAWMAMAANGQPSNAIPALVPGAQLVDLGGYNLYLNLTGEGKPAVVLIAGAGDYSFDWSLVQPQVSRFARVCSYDRCGSGWSDLGPTPRTMKQEAYELHLALRKVGLQPPYILVGHSVGGLIARVYAEAYPTDVAGVVLVDSTHEDTTLMYQGKLVRVREGAKARPVPPVQSMKSSPPKPPTEEDKKQAEFAAQFSGPPKIEPPFDKLPPDIQKICLWMVAHPKLSAATDDFWPEELQLLYEARAKTPCQLGDWPLVVLVPTGKGEGLPSNITADERARLAQEKRRQKEGFTALSRNSVLVYADESGHHIQLDQPDLVVNAIRRVFEAAQKGINLAQTK